MEEGTGIAIVTEVTRRPVVEVDEGAEVGFFTVRAKMYEPEHEYSADLFFVKILEPPGMGSLQNEQGSLMRHGEFGFEALQEVKGSSTCAARRRRSKPQRATTLSTVASTVSPPTRISLLVQIRERSSSNLPKKSCNNILPASVSRAS
jgi:hypothetical protein